jgi:hypothetical protein
LTLAIAARREIFLRLFELFATVCLFLLAAQALSAQQPQENTGTQYVIERIEIIGNRRIQSGTLRARIASHPELHISSLVPQRHDRVGAHRSPNFALSPPISSHSATEPRRPTRTTQLY